MAEGLRADMDALCELDGFFARAVCHELDHLDGILYIDRAERVERDTD